jgi:hypothetical protein
MGGREDISQFLITRTIMVQLIVPYFARLPNIFKKKLGHKKKILPIFKSSGSTMHAQ